MDTLIQPALRLVCRITVVDNCSYGRMGMTGALDALSGPGNVRVKVTGTASLLEYGGLWEEADPGSWGHVLYMDTLLVRLPLTPQAALSDLIQLADVLRPRAPSVVVVILSLLPSDSILRLLAGLGGRQRVALADARLPVTALCLLLSCPGSAEGNVTERSPVLLTPHERQVLRHSVQGIPVYSQARRRSVEPGTLYAQRASALRKLGVPHLHALLGCFRIQGSSKKGERGDGNNKDPKMAQGSGPIAPWVTLRLLDGGP